MSDQSEAALPVYVLSLEAVRRSIKILADTRSHEHLPGYLAIYKAQAERDGEPARMADLRKFHDDYLRVVDAPDRLPFIRPFKSRGKGVAFLNKNPSGSYAPNSIRNDGAFPKVVNVTGKGQDGSYRLNEGHALLMLSELLEDEKIPATSLAAFLLRDFGFHMEQPRIRTVVDIFREEFRFRPLVEAENEVFETLFVDDTSKYEDTDLEPFEGEVPA